MYHHHCSHGTLNLFCLFALFYTADLSTDLGRILGFPGLILWGFRCCCYCWYTYYFMSYKFICQEITLIPYSWPMFSAPLLVRGFLKILSFYPLWLMWVFIASKLNRNMWNLPRNRGVKLECTLDNVMRDIFQNICPFPCYDDSS